MTDGTSSKVSSLNRRGCSGIARRRMSSHWNFYSSQIPTHLSINVMILSILTAHRSPQLLSNSFEIKVARFRELLNAKKLHEESKTPHSSSVASRLTATSRSGQSSSTAASAGAKSSSWPVEQQSRSSRGGISLNLNDELEQEHQSKIIHSTTTAVKENRHPNNNLSTMTQIMQRKQQMTHAARKELDSSPIMNNSPSASEEKEDESSPSSSWAMLGCHMNETSLDDEGASSELLLLENSDLAVSPYSIRDNTNNIMRNGDGGGDGDGASGISGVLTFLGESPLFDQTLISEEEDEVERNLCRSAEKVKRLEEHLLRTSSGGEGMLSPVNPTSSRSGRNDNRNHRTKEVTFAIQDGMQTPHHGRSPHSTYPRTPRYMGNDDEINMSMQVQATPMNESAIISDDEASELDFGSTSPIEEEMGSGGDAGGASESMGSSGNEGDSNDSSEIGLLGLGSSSKVSGKGSSRRGMSKATTPTRASLMERNQTLVKEVRFADQTCVALSERKKYYKKQVGQYMETIKAANKENSTLRRNFESSLQESAKLKVLLESLQAQKHQADLQVEAYRAQITDSEKTHRSSLESMEKTHNGHLKIAEEQIHSLQERLNQSHATNSSLQSTLDRMNSKLESKLQSDVASKELIASLKERVASGDSVVQTANASMETMRKRISELEELCDQQKNQLQRERTERERTENNREDLQAQCDELHSQLMEWAHSSVDLEDVLFHDESNEKEGFDGELNAFTPVKHLCLDGSDANLRTPTSNLLARTLRSELKRRQHITEKLEHAEHQVSILNEKIFDMKMDHEEAKADNALLEEELEERKSHIATLETALAEKDHQVDLLCEEIEDLRRDGATSTDGDAESRSDSRCRREALIVLEERLDAVEETLEFTDEELIETKARLADTQELLERTAGELERSEEELAIACSKLSDYEIQVDSLFRDLTEKEVEHANLTKFSDFQTSTIDTLKDKLSSSEKVNVELRVQRKSCIQALAASEKVLRTYEDLEGIDGKMLSEQSRKIARLLETLERAPQDRVEVQTENHELDSVSTSETPVVNSNEPHALTAFCKRCMDSQEQFRIERDDANGQLQKANELIQEFRVELSKQESGYTKQIMSLNKQRTDLEESLSAVTAELKICQTENETLSATIAATENATSQQLSVIRTNNSELIKENESLRVSLQAYELQLEREQGLLRAAQEMAESYRLDVSNTKAAFECLSTQRDLTKASLSKVEKQLHELQQLVSEKEREIKTHKESLSIAQAELKEQTESLKSLEAELSVERESHHTVVGMLDEATNHVAMLENRMKTFEMDFEEKQNECQELIVQVKQIQNALEEAERDTADADGTISRLEIDIQEKKSIIFAYEESIISYKSDIRKLDNELQTTVQEKNNRIQMLEQACSSRQSLFSEQLDRTKKERDAFTYEVTEMINRLQNELEESNKSHFESEERSRITIFELNEAQRALEEEAIRKQHRLDEETKKYDDACQKLEDARKKMSVLTDRLNASEMDCIRVATKHQDEVEELLKDKNRLAGEKQQLEEQV